MNAFVSYDFTDLDLGPAARTAAKVTKATAGAARDVTYITVGFGVLAYQRLQVRRRELERGR